MEGEITNQFLYNGKEMLDEDADLGWIDYGFRNYDPQIGRFPQLDPLTDDFPLYTPYQYAGNEPITNIDLDGLEPAKSVLSMTEATAKTIETVVINAPKVSNNTNRIWGLVKVVGSALEVTAGVALGVTTGWTGAGAVVGGVIFLHGVDGLSAGLTQVISGKETTSYSEQGISNTMQKAGVSKENADLYAGYIDAGLSMLTTAGAAKLIKYINTPARSIPKVKIPPKAKNIKSAEEVLKPSSLGSTGRTTAENLTEQLAMKEIMSKPSAGKILIKNMKDASGHWNGWSKMSNKSAHGIEIHYNALWEDGVIKAIDDFKFVGGN